MGLGASTPEVDVDRLNEAETEELNDVIVSLDLDAVRKAGDSGHWLSLMALAAHRAKDFSVSARARILRAINAGTIHYPEVQAVQSLLLSVWGAPLSLTKLAVDAGTATDDGGDSGSKAAAASEGSRGRGFAHLVLKRMPEPVRATLLHHFQAYGYRDTRRRVAAVSLPGSSTRGAIVASAAHVGSGGSASGVPGASLGSNHAQRAAVPKLQLLEDHFTPHRSRSMRGGVGDPGTPPVQQPSTNASRREQQLDRVVAGEQLPTPDTGAGAGAGAGVGAGSGAGSGASATAPNQISVSAGASLPPDGEHGGGAASAPTGDAAPTDSAGAGSADAEVAGTAAASSQAPRPVSAPGSSSGAHLPALVPPASMQPIKVFCDIDDTFYASLYDCSFRRNTIYPGAGLLPRLARRPLQRAQLARRPRVSECTHLRNEVLDTAHAATAGRWCEHPTPHWLGRGLGVQSTHGGAEVPQFPAVRTARVGGWGGGGVGVGSTHVAHHGVALLVCSCVAGIWHSSRSGKLCGLATLGKGTWSWV